MTSQISAGQSSSLSVEMYQAYFEQKMTQGDDSVVFQESVYQKYDRITLNEKRLAPMGLFLNQINTSFADHFKGARPENPFPYPEDISSAPGLAGKILRKIEHRLFSDALNHQHASWKKNESTVTQPVAAQVAAVLEEAADETKPTSAVEGLDLMNPAVPAFENENIENEDNAPVAADASDAADFLPPASQETPSPESAMPSVLPQSDHLLNQFESGLASAFQETMNQLAEHFDTNASHTELYQANNLISKGIQSFRNLADMANTAVGRGGYQEVIDAHYRSEDLSLAIKTRDGDRISIAFHQIDQTAARNVNYLESRFSVGGTSVSKLFNNELALVIQGNLDEDELAAIGDLIDNVKQVADTFFNGDFASAFEEAMQMGFDTDALAGFTFSMALNQMDVTGVQTKPHASEAAVMPVAVSPSSAQPFTAMIQKMFQEIDELMRQPVVEKIEEPEKAIRDLFKMLADQGKMLTRNKAGNHAGHSGHSGRSHGNGAHVKLIDDLLKVLLNHGKHRGFGF